MAEEETAKTETIDAGTEEANPKPTLLAGEARRGYVRGLIFGTLTVAVLAIAFLLGWLARGEVDGPRERPAYPPRGGAQFDRGGDRGFDRRFNRGDRSGFGSNRARGDIHKRGQLRDQLDDQQTPDDEAPKPEAD